MPLLDVRADHFEWVKKILTDHVPQANVWAFGSRAKWLAKDTSDLDLCVDAQQPLSFVQMGLLKEAFEDSDLPYKVDVVDWATTSESFRKIIERDRVVVQRARFGMNEGWQVFQLSELVTFKYGKFLAKSKLNESGFPVFSGYGVVGYLPTYQFDDPQLLIVCRGEGGTGDVKMSPPKCSITNLSIVFSSNEKIVSKKFLYWALKASDTRQLRTGSAQAQIVIGSLEKLKIVIPTDKLQQDEITATLDVLDDRITLLRETNATLEAIAQALFKSWFVDFDPVRAKMEGCIPEGMDEATAALFPDSFEESELGLVPRGWRIGTLANLAEFQNGYAFKSKDWVDSGHPVVKIGDVKPGIIDFSGCSFVTDQTISGLDRFRLSRGDLLVGMTGYVGETGLVAEVEPAAYLNQRVGRIATTNGMKNGGFVYCLVRNSDFKTYAEAQSHGSAQANVSGSALLNYSSVIPAADVLSKFNGLIYPILETILANHETAQTLATLRDTLLPRLISGNLQLM